MTTDIYNNQTAILRWLRRRGHEVVFGRDYAESAPRPSNPPLPTQYARPLPHQQISGISHLRREAVGKPCPYCEEPMTLHGRRSKATKDHVVPRIRGGKLTTRNRLIVCAGCNGDKSSRTLEEWLVHLERTRDRRAQAIAVLIQKRGGQAAFP